MIKRITFLMASALMIAVSIILCTVFTKELPVKITDTTTEVTDINTPLHSTSEVSEDSVFNRVVSVDTICNAIGKYSEPETVSVDEFTFGEYLPVVFFNTLSNASGGYDTDYAMLGKWSIEEGTRRIWTTVEPFDVPTQCAERKRGILLLSDLDRDDTFYKHYASDGFYCDTDGVSVEEIGPSDFEITVPNGYYRINVKDSKKHRLQIEQIIGGRYVLLSYYKMKVKTHQTNPIVTDMVNQYAVYLYDLETDTMELLETYAVNPYLSPDMKYLIFTGNTKKQHISNVNANNIRVNSKGFYIKELESGKTVFYKYSNPGDFANYGYIGWIRADEVTDDGSKVVLKEKTQTFFDNTRELPKKAEGLKTLTVPFPENFPIENYKKPMLTSPNDFDFGDYMLNVTFSVGNITASHHVFFNSFLGKDIDTVDEGRKLFNSFNAKYLIKYPIKNFYYSYFASPPNSLVGSYLFNSMVTYISPDARDVITKSLIDTSDDVNVARYWYSYEGWTEKSDYYHDGKLTASESSTDYFYNHGLTHTVNLPFHKSRDSVPSNGDYVIYDEYFGDADVLSKSKHEWLCHISLPNVYNESEDGSLFSIGCDIRQVIDDRYLLMDMQKSYPESTLDSATYSHCTYLYDMETGEYTYLGNYMFETTISPDNRYLAYQTCWWDYIHDTTLNKLNEMEHGYFILDLETKKTVFYPHDYGYQAIVGWVSRKAIDATVAHKGSFVNPDTEQRKDTVLLESGKNTKKITLDIDPRIKVSNTAKWVEKAEFTVGKYIPFTKADNSYSFISLNEEINLYGCLCKKLSVPQDSELIYVSPEADRFGTYTDNDSRGVYTLTDRDGNSVFSALISEYKYIDLIDIYDGSNMHGYEPPLDDVYYSVKIVDGLPIYSRTKSGNTVINIYSKTGGEPLYEITLPEYIGISKHGYDTLTYCHVYSISEKGYVLLRAETLNEDYYGSSVANAYYLVDLNNETVIPLDNNIHELVISPDGSHAFGYHYSKDATHSVYVDLKNMNCIKYPSMEFIGWVNREKISNIAA